ncbi:MAG TPA: iron ABC transporter ATP-binding protein [Actinobacteria bacterium]|nr:iron ABC transporter ATP-binding protein [Actinomycetota bacterium]
MTQQAVTPERHAVVRLDGVSVLRGGLRILDGLSWQVREGEQWIILGQNGAGKTTLLEVLSTGIYPTTGTVEILGARRGHSDVFDIRPRIGLTSAALADRLPHPERVIDVVVTAAYGIVGRWRETYDPDDLARAHALLAQLGVAHLAARLFGTLSEGERKRVQIARALMPDPELLLLDEPAAGVDLGGREDLVGRLGRMVTGDWAPTSVMVTHHLEEIPAGYTHVLLLRAGRAFAAGPLADVLTPANLSQTFGVPLGVYRYGDRWGARLLS